MSTLDQDLQTLVARFEQGKPADPTANMSPEDAAKWKAMNEEHGDKFKTAADNTLADWQKALAHDEASLKKLQADIQKMKGGKHPEGWPSQVPLPKMLATAEKTVDSMEQAIKNKKALIQTLEAKAAAKTAARGDPYWLTAKYPGRAQDGTPFKKGDKVLYYPLTKTFFVGKKADEAWADFQSHAFDEDVYNYRAASGTWSIETVRHGKVWEETHDRRPILAEYMFKGSDDGLLDVVQYNDEYPKRALSRTTFEWNGTKAVVSSKPSSAAKAPRRRASEGDDAKEGKFEEGKPADPTKNMSPEDAAEWKRQNEEHKDKFKGAALDVLAQLDLELTAGTMPGVALEKDAAALERLAHLAMLDHTADQMIGRTILEQMGGQRRLSLMLGVTRFIPLPNGVAFQWPNKTPSKGNYIEIKLNGADLYDVSFFNVGRGAKKLVKSLDDVYAEDLVDIFERQTGWYLRMASEQAHLLVAAANKSKTAMEQASDGDEKEGKFEEGKPADPTENMSPEDAAEWKRQNEEHKDKFKTASDILRAIRPGDRVTIQTPQGQQVSGKAVMRGPAGWVLNLGGPHGRPGIATEDNIIKVVPSKRAAEDGKEAEGCPENLDESECAEWEANTEKYKDVVKDKAAYGGSVLDHVVSQHDLMKLEDKTDEQTFNLAVDVYQALSRDLRLNSGQQEALGRIKNSIENLSWREDMHRNNIFKAAHALGMKLPSAMFASTDKAAYEEGSRVPDGWDNGHIEGKAKTDEPGEEGSDTPDGNGNQAKRAGKKPTPAEIAKATRLFNTWRKDAPSGSDLDDLDDSWQSFLDGDLSLKDLENNPPTKAASAKVAGEVVDEMYALLSENGEMMGATDDWSDARSKSYWSRAIFGNHFDPSGGKLVTLVNVPLSLAEKFKDLGTAVSAFADGWAAWNAARRFAKGPAMRLASVEKEAAGTGLYGHTKRVQADCEACIRRVQKSAGQIARRAYSKHEGVAEFLAVHAKRAESLPARILVAALGEMGPKVARQMRLAELREDLDTDKKAGEYTDFLRNQIAEQVKAHGVTAEALWDRLGSTEATLATIAPPDLHFAKVIEAADNLKAAGLVTFDGVKIAKATDADAQTGEGIKQTTDKTAKAYGLYGFGERVASLGLQACTDLRHEAGKIAYDLHRRRMAHHAAIQDFFSAHSKQANCAYSRLLSASYPDAARGKTAAVPTTVQGWLDWPV